MKMHFMFCVIGLVTVFFASFVEGTVQDDFAPEVGRYAPAIELKDLNGKNITLAEFRGKVVLVNFWATWCSPCKAEMPSLNNLYLSLKDKGFVVLAIAADSSEKAVRSFVSDKGLAFPVLLADKDRNACRKYAIIGLPMSFLIDKRGIVVEKISGETDWASPDIKDKIFKLLNSNR